jgi:hypothetical protein
MLKIWVLPGYIAGIMELASGTSQVSEYLLGLCEIKTEVRHQHSRLETVNTQNTVTVNILIQKVSAQRVSL